MKLCESITRGLMGGLMGSILQQHGASLQAPAHMQSEGTVQCLFILAMRALFQSESTPKGPHEKSSCQK